MTRDPASLPYVQSYRVKGRQYFYFRRDGKRTRLRGDPGSPEWHAHYSELLAATDKSTHAGPSAGSVGAMIRSYADCPEFRRLGKRTQSEYLRQLDRLEIIAGQPAKAITRKHILMLRDKLQDRPKAADDFVTVTRILWRHGIEREFVSQNIATDIRKLSRAKRHQRWTTEDMARFVESADWTMRRALLVGYYIGLRRTDAVNLRVSDVRDGVLRYQPAKNGEPVAIPVSPLLLDDIATTPIDTLMLMPRPDGRAWNANSFSRAFRETREAAGLSDALHFHGLRHTAASEAAEAGATEAELQALLGHKSRAMAARYSGQAGRERLARSAVSKRERRDG
jgi:integrase